MEVKRKSKRIDEEQVTGTGHVILGNKIHVWYLNSKWHREDGPAIIYPSGVHDWCLDDKCYYFDDYCKELLKLGHSEEDVMVLKLKYGK